MDEQTIARYLELKDIIKSNREEMKPLRKELKEIEEEIINSGVKEITHYGMVITIEPKDKAKMNKEAAEMLIGQAIHNGNGTFEDYYEQTVVNKIKVSEQVFTNNKRGRKDDE